MPTIFTKDNLRASVESATGGSCTVLYTAGKHPCYMHIIPRFQLQDIDASLGTGTHPAFIVNGVEKSELFIGQFQGADLDGYLLSIPNVRPTVEINFDTCLARAAKNGQGWHIMTNAERSAIALWCWKNGFMPRGNTNWGKSDACPWETGRRHDNGAPGNTTGSGITLTGSGPDSWNHNGHSNGIADLCGNTWEWVTGLRLNNGEIQILPNNDAADNTKNVSGTSPLWQAISAATGDLVAPGTVGTLKYDCSTAAGPGTNTAILSDTIVNTTGNEYDTKNSFEGMDKKTGLNVPPIAKMLCLYPVVATGLGGDNIWIKNSGERLPLVGGDWNHGASAGVLAVALTNERANVSSYVSARPACIL